MSPLVTWRASVVMADSLGGTRDVPARTRDNLPRGT
jgi:hypothetical protein